MIELPVGYYLDNFHSILNSVKKQYADLLNADELAFAEKLKSLTLDAQRLYVRLSMRKGPVFRSDKVHYAEIGSIENSADELAGAGYLSINDTDIEQELALFNKAELLELLADNSKFRKSEKKETLLEIALNSISLEDAVAYRHTYYKTYTPLQTELMQVYLLLFFGNLHQDLTEFVLTDLGVVRYESYSIVRKNRMFPTRSALHKRLLIHQIGEMLFENLPLLTQEELLQLFDSCPEPEGLPEIDRRLEKILNTIARQLERLKGLENALNIYRTTSLPPSKERTARILATLGQDSEALEFCGTILDGSTDEQEREFAHRFETKLKKKLKLPVNLPPKMIIPSQTIQLEFQEGIRVEEIARSYYESQNTPAFYAENWLWTGLFALLFWDIIFMDIRGVFYNEYQSGPADLYSQDFRTRRLPEIEQRLAYLKSGKNLEKLALSVFDDKYGIANALVSWRHLTRELVTRAVSIIPTPHLVQVMDRMSRDLRSTSSGFPDLLVITEKYLLVEVKGPGDQLQENQKRWMRYFTSFGMPFLVLWVEPR